jgi:hypothetical protein
MPPEAAFEILSRERLDFLMAHPTPVILVHRQRIAEFARRKRLATITYGRILVDDGSLMMSYGPDFADLFRTAGLYVDKILHGARPGDLPVEQPTRFELMINLKTAKALRLTIPQSVLMRADEVIRRSHQMMDRRAFATVGGTFEKAVYVSDALGRITPSDSQPGRFARPRVVPASAAFGKSPCFLRSGRAGVWRGRCSSRLAMV